MVDAGMPVSPPVVSTPPCTLVRCLPCACSVFCSGTHIGGLEQPHHIPLGFRNMPQYMCAPPASLLKRAAAGRWLPKRLFEVSSAAIYSL